MYKKHFFGILLLLIVVPISSSMSSELNVAETLTLEECINLALEKSYEIRFLKSDIERDAQNVKAWRAYLKSNANVSFFLPSFYQEIDEIYDSKLDIFSYKYTKKNRFLSNLRINQPITTNGNFSFNYEFFFEEQLNDVRNYSNNFFIEFVQPIFTPNLLQMNIKRAEFSLKNTQLNFELRKLNIIHSVTANYYQLYEKIISYEIQEAETKQREETFVAAGKKMESGEISEMELIQLQVAYYNSEAELIKIKSELDEYFNYFKQLIGIGAYKEIRLLPDLDFNPEKVETKPVVKNGLKNSIILKQWAIWVEFARFHVIEVQQKNKFKGNISLTLGLDRKKPFIIDSFSHFDRTNSIVFNLSLPIWDWGKNRAEVASAKAWLRRRQLNLEENRLNVERGLHQAVVDINQAINRYNVLRKNREAAQKSYDLAKDKFDRGEISAQDIMNNQKRLTRSKLSYFDAITDYNRAIADLRKREKGGYGYVRIYRPGSNNIYY